VEVSYLWSQTMYEVHVSSMSPGRFGSVLPPERFEEFERSLDEGRRLLDGRVVWNVNSTARGGGVAELLQSLVPYARGAGADVRWVVIEGTPEFFTLTKRIHNRLHGSPGDGGALDDRARDIYERVMAQNMPQLMSRVRPGDVVIVHDPQPGGLIGGLREAGASVIWRCHVGLDRPNDLAREAWKFLLPYISAADAFVFSRESFVWEGLDPDQLVIIPPTIDVFSPKNIELESETVFAVLRATGLLSDGTGPRPATFVRHDGTPGRVDRPTELFGTGAVPSDVPVVVQISRWDVLKDPHGVIRGFADFVPESTGAHLVCAGPAVAAVADDPEGLEVLRQSVALWERLPDEQKRRVHLASLPMDDPAENATIVNALQRYAAVIVQKSLAEGFGLTVAEAMWKGRPVVASRIGGIETQIIHGETGLLLDDPRDLKAYADAVTGLLLHPPLAQRLGERARERVRIEFTSPRSLLDYLSLIKKLLVEAAVPPAA
jgi:trehalose synthase